MWERSMMKLGALIVSLCAILGWITVVGFSAKHWNAATVPTRVAMISLIVSYPLPLLHVLKDKFQSWRIGVVTYVALTNFLWLLLISSGK